MKKPSKKPKLIADSTGRLVHPLVKLRESVSPAIIGKRLGHASHATVTVYTSRARRRPTMPIPAEWVLPLCRLGDFCPADLRPDLYLPEWTVRPEAAN
jgi:hypothetical protein